MAAAGLTVIRVGESVWSTWEPEDGRFELEWLAPVLDGAHARGIKVILGTPTYAMPPWLVRKYPEVTAERRTGARIPYGHRQDGDYSHAAFRWHADRITRKVVGALRPAPGRDRLPGRQRAGHGALPQPRGLRGLRRQPARAVRGRRERSTASGVSSTGRTASPAGTSCGRRTATRSPPTTSPGGATSRRSRRTSSPRRPTSCASSPARISSSPPAWRCSDPPSTRATSTARASTSPRSTRTTRCRTR